MDKSLESISGLTTSELLEYLDFLLIDFDHSLPISSLEELLVSNLVGSSTIPLFSPMELRDIRDSKNAWGIEWALKFLTQKLVRKLSLNPHPLDYLRPSLKAGFQKFSGIETTDEMVSEIIKRSRSYIKSGYDEKKEEYHWFALFTDYKKDLDSVK